MTSTSSWSLRRWSLCTVLITAVAPLGAPLVAQDTTSAGRTGGAAPARAEVELTRAEVQANRMAIVRDHMHLTDAQSEKFWPLYREYRSEAQKASDETMRFMSSLADRATPLSDAEASHVLNLHLDRQEQMAKVNRAYAKKFLAVLPPRQVARLFQLENKMDAIVAYGLAGVVPLISEKDRPTPDKDQPPPPPDPRN